MLKADYRYICKRNHDQYENQQLNREAFFDFYVRDLETATIQSNLKKNKVNNFHPECETKISIDLSSC